jgi:hypothetical protein
LASNPPAEETQSLSQAEVIIRTPGLRSQRRLGFDVGDPGDAHELDEAPADEDVVSSMSDEDFVLSTSGLFR